jgi:predicted ester cyclase
VTASLGADRTATMHPFVALMRLYVLDYLACGNTEVCAQIMEPDYLLHMGGHELGPRDDVYVPAVARQLQQFPGLNMTVNELICSGDRLAIRFSQHGASMRHERRPAAWSGVGLYHWNGSRLTSNWALEDYHARRRQLDEGWCNPVEGPAVAPWDEQAVPGDPAAEAVVRDWLQGSLHGTPGVRFDDEWVGHQPHGLLDVAGTVIDDVFAAGDRVAFHVTQTGSYTGGLGRDELIGTPVTLRSAGIVTVTDGVVAAGHVVRDRAGLLR